MVDQLNFDHSFNHEISNEDIIHEFRVWKEKTTTSPSGRYLGTWKILLQPNSVSEKQDYQKEFSDLFTKIMNTCLLNNHVLKRWTKAHTFLISKDKGSMRVNRIRNLQIVEADANMLVKHLVARKTLGDVEKMNSYQTISGGDDQDAHALISALTSHLPLSMPH